MKTKKTKTNDEKIEKLKEIYKLDNWLPLHIQQLSYLRNLILLIAFGALGFTVTLFDNILDITFRILFIITSCFYLIVICLGFLIAYYESENYRIKYKISRVLIKNPNYDHSSDEKECTKLENSNRCLIKVQIVLFSLTIIFETILFIFYKN